MSQETRVMGLSDGRKSFRIVLAVLIQYRSVAASHPASHVAVAITLCAIASSLKTIVVRLQGREKFDNIFSRLDTIPACDIQPFSTASTREYMRRAVKTTATC